MSVALGVDASSLLSCLFQQALRKAPQRTARGFRIATQQLDCLVQLLIGEVPERSLFNNIDTREALGPYLELTQAVYRYS